MQTLERLAVLLEQRIPGISGHSHRVGAYAGALARAVGLSGAEREQLERAGTVHDIGKSCVPGAVLNKPGPLTAKEWELVRLHAETGAAMVAGFGDAEAAELVRHHHERFDGGGYPDGLAGNRIPFGARILAVVDTFDALTSDRPYRRAVEPGRALAVLRTEAGTQFDPELVACFAADESMLQAA